MARHVMVDRDRLVVAQFGPRAEAYVASSVHAGGADLDLVAMRAAAARPASALDLGCGGGHVAYALSPFALEVTAVDLSEAMLAGVCKEAARRGLGNIATVQASVENLPFADAHFDFVVSRFSAHHWCDLAEGLREARRVMRRGATGIFIDIVSPGAPALDTHLQAIELLRDPSHVRDYTESEWRDALVRADFSVLASQSWRLRMDFSSWIARMATPPVHTEAILSLQGKAEESIRRHFAIEQDGGFLLDAALFEVMT